MGVFEILLLIFISLSFYLKKIIKIGRIRCIIDIET